MHGRIDHFNRQLELLEEFGNDIAPLSMEIDNTLTAYQAHIEQATNSGFFTDYTDELKKQVPGLKSKLDELTAQLAATQAQILKSSGSIKEDSIRAKQTQG